MEHDLVESVLKKYFEFDKIFNLLTYGVSLQGLREDLEPLCKSSYGSNYRFVFLHYDTDYHITNDQPGIILRNLQKILRSLDISNFFCLVVSQKNLSDHLEMLRLQETSDDVAIFCLQHPLQENKHFEQIPVEINIDQIRYKFMSLNRVKRFHRTLLYAFLKKHGLLAHGAVSYGARFKIREK